MSNIDTVRAVSIHRSAHFHQWEYLDVLKRYRGLIALFTLSATLGALLLTYIYTEKYQAVGEVLYRSMEAVQLTNNSTTVTSLGSPPPQAEFKVIKDTVDDTVHSDNLLLSVVRQLHLDAPPNRDYSALPWYLQYYNETKDWLNDNAVEVWRFLKFGRYIERDPAEYEAQQLGDDIDVDSEDSYLLSIKVKYKDPVIAAKIADAVTARLDQTFSEHSKDSAAITVQRLERQFDDKRNQLLTDRAQILDLLQSNHVANVASEIGVDINQMSTYRGNLTNYQNDIANTRAVIADLDTILAGKPAGPRAPSTIAADDFKKAQSDRLFDNTELQGKLAAAATLQRAISDLDARLQALPAVQTKYDELSTELQVAANDYAKLSDALTEARIQQAGLASEVQILGPAAVPTDVATPIKIYHTGIALGLGLIVAMGLVYMLNYFNLRMFLPMRGVGGRRPAAPTTSPNVMAGPAPGAAE